MSEWTTPSNSEMRREKKKGFYCKKSACSPSQHGNKAHLGEVCARCGARGGDGRRGQLYYLRAYSSASVVRVGVGGGQSSHEVEAERARGGNREGGKPRVF